MPEIKVRDKSFETYLSEETIQKRIAEMAAEINRDYEGKRQRGGLEAPFVRLVMPGFFAHWMRHHGKWGGQHKMPRCRSDRVIADELKAIACFNAD